MLLVNSSPSCTPRGDAGEARGDDHRDRAGARRREPRREHRVGGRARPAPRPAWPASATANSVVRPVGPDGHAGLEHARGGRDAGQRRRVEARRQRPRRPLEPVAAADGLPGGHLRAVVEAGERRGGECGHRRGREQHEQHGRRGAALGRAPRREDDDQPLAAAGDRRRPGAGPAGTAARRRSRPRRPRGRGRRRSAGRSPGRRRSCRRPRGRARAAGRRRRWRARRSGPRARAGARSRARPRDRRHVVPAPAIARSTRPSRSR